MGLLAFLVGSTLLQPAILASPQGQATSVSIEGHVVSYSTHKPLKGWRLTVNEKSAVTDAKGHFRFDGSPKDLLMLRIEGYGMAAVEGGDTKIEVRIRDSSFHTVKVGEPMPDMKLSHWLNSKPLTNADLKGRVVFLDFWGVNCPPCCEALPSIEALSNKLEGKAVVIGIHFNDIDAKRLSAFAKKNNLTYPLAIDKGGDGGLFTDLFVTHGIPTIAVIDRDGKIALLPDTVDEAEAKIEELLAAGK